MFKVWGTTTAYNRALGIGRLSSDVTITPTTLVADSELKNISFGTYVSCAIGEDSSLWTWGQQHNVALGSGALFTYPITQVGTMNNPSFWYVETGSISPSFRIDGAPVSTTLIGTQTAITPGSVYLDSNSGMVYCHSDDNGKTLSATYTAAYFPTPKVS